MSEMTICGRIFRAADLEIIREIIQREQTNRTQISREVCRVLNWFKPDGKLKEMSCRVALLRLHRLGILEFRIPMARVIVLWSLRRLVILETPSRTHCPL